MKPPCIIVVRYILPTIRVLIAKELISVHGLSRVRAAKMMGLTPAAITQYLKNVRGETAVKTVESSDEATKAISEMADHIANGDASAYDMLLDLCKICRITRAEGLLCEMHKTILPVLREIEACECGLDTCMPNSSQT